MNKRQFLNDIARKHHSITIEGCEKLYKKRYDYLYEMLKKYFVLGSALELGCGNGILTQRICKDFEKVTAVDGSKIFIEKLKKQLKISNLHLVNNLFEEFSPNEQFNTIFMTHILEHVDTPVKLLKRSKEWLATDGRVLIVVPNANSLHRLIGVKLGMLKQKNELSEVDQIVGHKRIYTLQLLSRHIQNAGFRIIYKGGCMLKILSTRQMENWSPELIDALYAVGKDMPKLCSKICIVIEANK